LHQRSVRPRGKSGPEVQRAEEDGVHEVGDQLREQLFRANIARGRRMVCYDGAGIAAAKLAFALTLLGLLYVSWFLGHALLLRHLADGAGLVLVLVSVTWVGETAAYAVGSWLGRHKLVPAISPGKTVEGALAQLVASIVAAVVFGPGWLLPSWTMGFAAGAGAILGVVGQLGDLAESAIKRSVGVKDAGGLIPGHGGVLDRIDGLLFNVPALYYYVRLGTGA